MVACLFDPGPVTITVTVTMGYLFVAIFNLNEVFEGYNDVLTVTMAVTVTR